MSNSRVRKTSKSRRPKRGARVPRGSSRTESRPGKADRSSPPAGTENVRQPHGRNAAEKLVAAPKELVWKKRLKKLSIPVALVVIGCALCVWAYFLKPSRGDVGSPSGEYLLVSSSVKLKSIDYRVNNTRPSNYTVDILGVADNLSIKHGEAVAYFGSPDVKNTYIPHCSPPINCNSGISLPNGIMFSGYSAQLNFDGGTFDLNFKIHSPNFSFSSNGVEALAKLPLVEYQGPGNPMINVIYLIDNGSSYDWSPLVPSASLGGDWVEWDQPVAFFNRSSASEVAGTNHANQDSDSNYTFLAGALVGVGGSALIGAMQEALHLWPGNSESERRSRSLGGSENERS